MDKIKFGEKEYLVKYRHDRGVPKTFDALNPRGGVTTAQVEIPNGTFNAIAVCSPLDNFSKKRGRVIALGRLKKKLAMIESKE